MNLVVFNTFLVPTLEFVAQLCVPSPEIVSAMTEAMRRLAPGPDNWCAVADLETMNVFGMEAYTPRELKL